MLDGVATISISLGRDPEEVLGWRESKFYCWLPLLKRAVERRDMEGAIATNLAMWSPATLAEMLGADGIAEEVPEDKAAIAEAAITRAYEIRRMSDSGSKVAKAKIAEA